MTKIKLDWGYNPYNFHNNKRQKVVTINGPKFKVVELCGIAKPTTAYRFIFYKPSGAWFYLDVTFDRRGLK
jgi:hypothetical protein